jgi:hypothetical protein
MSTITVRPAIVANKVARRWAHARARAAVEQDYLGAKATFSSSQFQRVFRVSQTVVERIIQIAGASSPFFCNCGNAVGKASIASHVKVLMGIKLMAYGVSPSAFQDYFQMGESTAMSCMKQLAFILANDPGVKAEFLCPMSKHDAKSVVEFIYRI